MGRIVLDPKQMRRASSKLRAQGHSITGLEGKISPSLATGAPPAVAARVRAQLEKAKKASADARGSLDEIASVVGTRADLAVLADAGMLSDLLALMPGALDGVGGNGSNDLSPKDRRKKLLDLEKKFRKLPEAEKKRMKLFLGVEGSTDKLFGKTLVDLKGKLGPFAGKLNVEAGLRVKLSGKAGIEDGNLMVEGGAEARLGVSADGKVEVGNKDIGADLAASAFAGARAEAKAGLQLGKDGVRANAKADAFAGVEAKATAGGHLSGVGASGSAGVSLGIGAHAEVDAGFTHGKAHVKANLGAAVGLGVNLSVDVTVDPGKIAKDTIHVASEAADLVKHVHVELPKIHVHIEPPKIHIF